MLRLTAIIFVCLVFGLRLNAQQYGFEWIQSGQPYYKFKVAQNGLYRIDSATLSSAGVSLSGLHPKRFQVFRNGIEVPIFIHGQQDGVLDGTDYIEFWAEKNDGKLDSLLYNTPSWQPNTYTSFFGDTAIYFLTILPDPQQGLRYTQTSDGNFGAYTAETYCMQEVVQAPVEEYLFGIDLAGASSEVRYYESEFTEGEGWASNRLSAGFQRNYTLATPFKAASGPDPSLEVKVIGASNAANVNINHHVQLLFGPDVNTLSVVDDRTFSAYQVIKSTPTVTQSQLGATSTILAMKGINDLGAASDYNSMSYIKLNYARQYQLGNTTRLLFSVVHQQGALKSRLVFTGYGTGSQTAPIVYDLTARQRVYATVATQTLNALITNDGKQHRVFVCDSSEIQPITTLQAVTFPQINPLSNYEFLIVSNEKLLSATNNYASYRSNRFNVLKVTSTELYDYYMYGNNSPLAVKRFVTHLIKASTQDPKFLLLAGRGFQADLLHVPAYYANNLVPAMGVPSSDAMFSSGIEGNGRYAEVPTGRVPALTNEELDGYLSKLVDYETASDSIQLWRKNVIHVTGGGGSSEQQSFINQFKKNEQTIRDTFTGYIVQTFSKNNSEPQQIDMRDKILAAQNNGATLFSFYGHASLTILDVDIGNITDLDNPRKYPLYYFSGCNVGNANAEDPANSGDVYAKTYICTPNKGAIGWLAHTNFSYTGNLNTLQNGFYSQYAKNNYGKPIGVIMQEVTKGITGTDAITRSHSLQWLYQGDPATVIYSPGLPDYQVTSQDIFVTPANANTQIDSFELAVAVNNLGKAITDSVTITVNRKLPNNTTLFYGPVKYKGVYYKDTLYVKMFAKSQAMVGNNVFDVTINQFSGATESNMFNNKASYTYYLPGQGLQLLSPAMYAIIGDDSVEMVAQSNDLFASNNEYIFELDTIPSFNSPMYRTSGVKQAQALVSWKVLLPQADTQPYYWRARLNVPLEQGGSWLNGSFTYIPGSGDGWIQKGFYQYTEGSHSSDMDYDSVNQKLAFKPDYNDLIIRTGRWRHSGFGVLDPMPLNPQVFMCISNGIVCILYDKKTLSPFVNPRFARSCSTAVAFNYPYYAFDTRNVADQDEFIRFVDSAATNTYFAIYSYYDSGSPSWTPAFRAKLASLGSVQSAAINNYYSAFTMMGLKGAAPGTIVEDTIYNDTYNSPNVADTVNNAISNVLLEGKWYTGSLSSNRIGPVKNWKSVSFNFLSEEESSPDNHDVSVYAVKSNGIDSLVLLAQNNGAYNLSTLSSDIYPYLRLKVLFTDTFTRTPDQFGYWKVDYDGATEGALLIDNQFSFYNKKVKEGDSLMVKVQFKNVSTELYDSIPVEYKIVSEDRVVKYVFNEMYDSLASGQKQLLSRKLPTVGLKGNNQLVVTVNAQEVIPEITLVNNVLNQTFEVENDVKNPVMDVTFDGYRIMNGDIVSPMPVITVMSKDENVYRLQTDTATFSLYLKRPTSVDYERISMSDSRVLFHPASSSNNRASVEFKPERLADGMYKLKVLSKDASGNASGNAAYEVEFQVINESTITNFFPYPNPFTTQMRFVFTLTGATPPDDLIVRIMTITGKVVKEITKDEFGPIKIGNNVSEFAWDGTDNYGDRLANGVYLYQVLTRINGEGIKKRDTDADRFVTHSTGKIYMLK